MGVLETRALDFDRLIILSMNEGIFPCCVRRQTHLSRIICEEDSVYRPMNIRTVSGPTIFYRLIYRASHVSLLYDTRSNGLQTGEVSRFVHQLHYHYEVPLQKQTGRI